ncbi:hypothetical protein CSPX01_11085 [Colletotrichum filicis]|nr:hypothetical protein CSPX01_11085 [Colletotrichum filicis]
MLACCLVISFLHRLRSCSTSDMECCSEDVEVTLTSNQLLVGRERLSDSCVPKRQSRIKPGNCRCSTLVYYFLMTLAAYAKKVSTLSMSQLLPSLC